MNQKDYKEIASINKKQLRSLLEEEERLSRILEQDTKANSRNAYWATKQLLDRCKEKIRIIKNIIFDQADYFEKEDNKNMCLLPSQRFDKDQFLKYCGLNEKGET